MELQKKEKDKRSLQVPVYMSEMNADNDVILSYNPADHGYLMLLL